MLILAGCTSDRPSAPPAIIYVGCPAVSSCPVPASHPATNEALSADILQLESALLNCGLQIETIKKCQEAQHAKTDAIATTAD
ncbi:Rz1-like lysis system protein LysC [Rahnella victoriana]|uniref:Rz1-like lysis system protein LysC n=1 Tax=Rahnella victoriana TaxID=1510570 RepID=UPI001E4B5D03|nr:Rz1-like lysis system protein LysC [Rahnella victoriana]UHM92857.1 Rz1-like lysis system protein LysC [Rahnella victoriana]